MATIKETQAVNIKFVLDQLGLTYEQFAEKINAARPAKSKGFSPTSIYNWRHGKCEMGKAIAEEIHGLYPQFSVDFLRGRSVFPNQELERAAARERSVINGLDKEMCVERLANHYGFTASALGLFDAKEFSDGGYHSPAEMTNVQHVEKIENAYGETLVLTEKQWTALVDEVGAYLQMRLNMMFERGGW